MNATFWAGVPLVLNTKLLGVDRPLMHNRGALVRRDESARLRGSATLHRSPVLEGAGDGGGGVIPVPGPIEVCPAHGFVDQYELGADPALGSFWIADYPDATKITRVPRRYHKYKMGPLPESVLTEHFAVAAGSVYAFTWQICPGGTRARANL